MSFISKHQKQKYLNIFNKMNIYKKLSLFFALPSLVISFCLILTCVLCLLLNVHGEFDHLRFTTLSHDSLTDFGLSMTSLFLIFLPFQIASIYILIKLDYFVKKNKDQLIKVSVSPNPGVKSKGTISKNISERLEGIKEGINK